MTSTYLSDLICSLCKFFLDVFSCLFSNIFVSPSTVFERLSQSPPPKSTLDRFPEEDWRMTWNNEHYGRWKHRENRTMNRWDFWILDATQSKSMFEKSANNFPRREFLKSAKFNGDSKIEKICELLRKFLAPFNSSCQLHYLTNCLTKSCWIYVSFCVVNSLQRHTLLCNAVTFEGSL